MRKAILILSLLLIAAVIIIGYILNGKTTPESRLKQQFNVDLADVEFSINNTKEKWYPNGDGFYFVEMGLKEGYYIDKLLTSSNFKSLPVTENIPENEIPTPIEFIREGYYQYGLMDTDPRNFKIAIYDTKSRTIIFYYQLM